MLKRLIQNMILTFGLRLGRKRGVLIGGCQNEMLKRPPWVLAT
jgi:hypothetical protein